MNERADSDPPTSARGNPLDRLIRSPDLLLAELDGPGAARLLAMLALTAIAGHLAYGLVVGSFSGGAQWWAAPSKIVLGTVLCGAICYPSLYIFSTLSGAEVRAKHVLGLLLGLLALTAVFLVGFAPVAWVFSQSSTLVFFIGAIHLIVWGLSILVSVRVLHASLKRWKSKHPELTLVWALIFLLTCCQMMTTLRPLVGRSDRYFDPEKKFFLQHYLETIEEDAKAK
ncbi:MAG: hypothetical protein ACKVXR_08205 [Planctomycetota bacterium]